MSFTGIPDPDITLKGQGTSKKKEENEGNLVPLIGAAAVGAVVTAAVAPHIVEALGVLGEETSEVAQEPEVVIGNVEEEATEASAEASAEASSIEGEWITISDTSTIVEAEDGTITITSAPTELTSELSDPSNSALRNENNQYVVEITHDISDGSISVQLVDPTSAATGARYIVVHDTVTNTVTLVPMNR